MKRFLGFIFLGLVSCGDASGQNEVVNDASSEKTQVQIPPATAEEYAKELREFLKNNQGKPPSTSIRNNQGKPPSTSTTTASNTFKDCPECPEMVNIPAGSFMMGSANGDNDEKPVHEVKISVFAMSKYEVTFEEYDVFAKAVGRDLPNDQGWGRGKRPVINVTWHDAVAYTEWLSQKTGKAYRLPTEAEWEYAARAGTTIDYWWGNNIGHNNANCDGCGSQWDSQQTAPVGSFKANPFGLYDTAGNVWEWTCSRYTSTYEGNELTCDMASREARVLRGGSWNNDPNRVRSAYRSRSFPTDRYFNGGFRVLVPFP